MSLYFKGNPPFLAMCRPTWPLLLCAQSAISTERSVARSHTQARASAACCQGGSAYYRQGHGRQWGLPQALESKSKYLSTNPDPTRAYSWPSTPWLLVVQAKGSSLQSSPAVSAKGEQPRVIMSDHQPNCSEFSLLASVAHFYFQAHSMVFSHYYST